MLNARKLAARLSAVAVFALLLGGCGPAENQYVAPPPPEVSVANPAVLDVPRFLEFTGQTRAMKSVEIRARVAGYLDEVLFDDGDLVRKGEVLFRIDPREYNTTLQQREADVLTARSALDFSQNDLDRREKALQENAVSELDVLRARAERDQASATLAAAEAAVEQAKLDLSYTEIHTPVAGRVSRHLVDIGNLVGYSDPTLLTTVRSLNPMHYYFDLDERTLVETIGIAVESGRVLSDDTRTNPIPIQIALSGSSEFTINGVVDYMDNTVNPATGTIQLRATIDNSRMLAIPGLFARGRVTVKIFEDALLVPEIALGVDQAGRYLLIAGEGDIIEQRSVTLGPPYGTLASITDGLEPDDRVVVNGILRARPGAPVTPLMTTIEIPEILPAPAMVISDEDGTAGGTDAP